MLKHGTVKIVAVIVGGVGLGILLLSVGGGDRLARSSSALERLPLASNEGVDLLGGVGSLLLSLDGLGEGLVASGLALFALGFGGLRALVLFVSGRGSLWVRGGVSAMDEAQLKEGLAQSSG